ncbi:MAG: SMP-30/gluconolactonase/LRE family protein [Actinobacteria bacterium]|nr:SMP-30/gluconolactonase/LRE family protein [Actinomycetota bacterium]
MIVGALRYRPFAGDSPVPGELVYCPPGAEAGETVVWDAGTLTWPNGLGFSPDGRWLYAADFASGIVHRAAWHPDSVPATSTEGRLHPWVRTLSGQADGLAVDAAGAVWVALGNGGALARYLPDGELDTVLDTAKRTPDFHSHAANRLRSAQEGEQLFAGGQWHRWPVISHHADSRPGVAIQRGIVKFGEASGREASPNHVVEVPIDS